ncbi:MAG: hypothetical protein ACE5G3_08065 [Gammaproteobacteria bacterium]
MTGNRFALVLVPLLSLAACGDQPAGGGDIFAPVGGTVNAQSSQAGDAYLTQDFGRLPPDSAAQTGTSSDFANTVTAAIDEAEAQNPAGGGTGAAAATSGIDPNAESINLAESSQAEQKAQREVAARELEEARQQLVIVQPETETVPSATVNIAKYARETTNRVGQRLYQRPFSVSGEASRSRCRRFVDADAAQRVFLQNGGPRTDKLNLDPDGDGFACGWSPEPFRSIRVPGQ